MKACLCDRVVYAALDGDLLVRPLAAYVTRVNEDGTLNLWVFPDGRSEVIPGERRNVSYGGPSVAQTWYWPPHLRELAPLELEG